MHDAFGRFYAKRHGGRIDPEARLTISYPATCIMVVSLIVIGLGIQNHWHYMVLAVFAAAQCCGIMISTTAVNAYLLDCYPGNSGEVSAWVSIGRIWGGFHGYLHPAALGPRSRSGKGPWHSSGRHLRSDLYNYHSTDLWPEHQAMAGSKGRLKINDGSSSDLSSKYA